MSIVNKLKALKGNLFGGKGNTGVTKPPASTVQDFDLQSSPTGILDIDPLAFSTMSYPLDVQNNFQNGLPQIFTFIKIVLVIIFSFWIPFFQLLMFEDLKPNIHGKYLLKEME